MAAVLGAPRLPAARLAGGWLFGPAPDLLLGCGLLSLLAFGVFMLGGSALRPEDSELRAQRDQLARLIGPGVANAAPTAEGAR